MVIIMVLYQYCVVVNMRVAKWGVRLSKITWTKSLYYWGIQSVVKRCVVPKELQYTTKFYSRKSRNIRFSTKNVSAAEKQTTV
jgi:hypothetical protein